MDTLSLQSQLLELFCMVDGIQPIWVICISNVFLLAILLCVHTALSAHNAGLTAENEKLRRERERQRKYIGNLNDSLKHCTVQNEELTRRLSQSSVGMVEGEKDVGVE